MAPLPKYVSFSSFHDNKYLSYKKDKTETRSLLQFEGNDDAAVTDPRTQFKIVESKIGGGLVHIKCRYNNLYFVRWSRSHYWISASAYEANEDITSWACTLFKSIELGDSEDFKTIRLLHVQSERYVRLPSSSSVSAPYASCLLADSKEPDDSQSPADILVVFNLKFPLKIPKRVSFRGDNGLYLGAQLFDGRPGLQFSFKDVNDPKAAHQVITFPDGTISVKSDYYGSFWRVEEDVQNNYIVVDADGPNPDGANNTDTTGTFRVNWIDLYYAGLLSMSPTLYLKRMNGPDTVWKNSIGAATQNIDPSARIRIVNLDE